MPRRNVSAERGIGIGSSVILRHLEVGPGKGGFGAFYFARHRIDRETRASWLIEKAHPADRDVRIPKGTLAGTYTEDEIRALEARYGRRYLPVRDVNDPSLKGGA